MICDAAGVLSGDMEYYDFKYPNAEKLMMVADAQWEEGTDEFNIRLPSEFVFYERSYSHYAIITVDRFDFLSKMEIDGSEISSIQGESANYGLLSPSQLPPNEFHTIKLTAPHWTQKAFGAIVLVYREA